MLPGHLLTGLFFLGRIQKSIKRSAADPLPPADIRSLYFVIVITSLLGEHCDFERVRQDVPGMSACIQLVMIFVSMHPQAVTADLEAISPNVGSSAS